MRKPCSEVVIYLPFQHRTVYLSDVSTHGTDLGELIREDFLAHHNRSGHTESPYFLIIGSAN